MTDNPAEVYRTRLPEALETFDRYREAHREWREKVAAFCEKHSDTPKFWHNSFLHHEYFIGLVAPKDGKLAPGWRIERKNGMMVPAKRTPEGKALAAEMRKIDTGPVLTLGGMPQESSVEYSDGSGRGRIYTFGVKRGDDYLEVSWAVPVPQDKVDFEIWEKVPLSQWHAEREALALPDTEAGES